MRFYFDFVSPYAYVAWSAARQIATRHGRSFEAIPVLFAALLDAHGQKGPAEIPAKRAYVFKDAYRKAHRSGLPPLVLPPSHPFNPLVALRVASLPHASPDERLRAIDALFDAAWARGESIEGAEAVAAVLSRAGLDGERLVASAQEPAAKARLRDTTADAVAKGVFGVPTLFVDDEMFWGTDSLGEVEARLRSEDPLPAGLSFDRPASATRKPSG